MKVETILKAVRQLIAGEIPKIDISSVLLEHKCYDLAKQMPDGLYYNQARLLIRLNKMCVRERIRACKSIFEQNEIPYAAIKGPILSVSAYGNPYLRQSGDLDILIAPEDISVFSNQMKDNGFKQGKIRHGMIECASREDRIFHSMYSHQIVPFIKETGNSLSPFLNVDVNTSVYWGEKGRALDIKEILSNCITEELEGVSIKKMEPVSEFIILCLHHYKDMNSLYLLAEGNLKLRLFVDIYRYILRQQKNLSMDRLRRIAKEWSALPYVYYCLFQTSYLFPDQVVMAYRDAMQNEEGQNLINLCGLTREEQKRWTMPLEVRLFSSDFKDQFKLMLDDKDREKIALNIQMMQ